jgi:actin related protein 2/3 complex subunit 1A/1B
VTTVRGLDGTAAGCLRAACSVQLANMPFVSLAFVSDTTLVAGGFDCSPVLFQTDATGEFAPVRILTADGPVAQAKRAGSFNAAFDHFRSHAEKGEARDTAEAGAPIGPHKNVISCVRAINATMFTTTALDGQVVVWTI